MIEEMVNTPTEIGTYSVSNQLPTSSNSHTVPVSRESLYADLGSKYAHVTVGEEVFDAMLGEIFSYEKELFPESIPEARDVTSLFRYASDQGLSSGDLDLVIQKGLLVSDARNVVVAGKRLESRLQDVFTDLAQRPGYVLKKDVEIEGELIHYDIKVATDSTARIIIGAKSTENRGSFGTVIVHNGVKNSLYEDTTFSDFYCAKPRERDNLGIRASDILLPFKWISFPISAPILAFQKWQNEKVESAEGIYITELYKNKKRNKIHSPAELVELQVTQLRGNTPYASSGALSSEQMALNHLSRIVGVSDNKQENSFLDKYY